MGWLALFFSLCQSVEAPVILSTAVEGAGARHVGEKGSSDGICALGYGREEWDGAELLEKVERGTHN